jgi:hypothetical protein
MRAYRTISGLGLIVLVSTVLVMPVSSAVAASLQEHDRRERRR